MSAPTRPQTLHRSHKPVSSLVFAKGFVCASDMADVTLARVACLIDQI